MGAFPLSKPELVSTDVVLDAKASFVAARASLSSLKVSPQLEFVQVESSQLQWLPRKFQVTERLQLLEYLMLRPFCSASTLSSLKSTNNP